MMRAPLPSLSRRLALGTLAAGAAALAAPGLLRAQAGSAQIVVVGGGFGGATAARYLRQLLPAARITLVEPAARYYSCAFSSLYLAGLRDWESLGHGYDALRAKGIDVVQASAEDIDPVARTVTLAGGRQLHWDKLVLSPGIDMRWYALPGYDEAAAELAPHAWKAGAQTHLLREQLQAMPDGGTFAMVIPAAPYRCPPGPYERAALVAHYLTKRKPRSKILLLDAKDDFSKKPLFLEGWKQWYGDMIEWRPLAEGGAAARVDAPRREVEDARGGRHRADVLNVIPAQKAGWIAARAGVVDASGWAPVRAENFASTLQPHVHVIGDAAIATPMPKSGASANSQAKLVAAALQAELLGREAPEALYINTCYSLLGPMHGISVAGVYRAQAGKLAEVRDSGGISPLDAGTNFRQAEAAYALAWYETMAGDAWGG